MSDGGKTSDCRFFIFNTYLYFTTVFHFFSLLNRIKDVHQIGDKLLFRLGAFGRPRRRAQPLAAVRLCAVLSAAGVNVVAHDQVHLLLEDGRLLLAAIGVHHPLEAVLQVHVLTAYVRHLLLIGRPLDARKGEAHGVHAGAHLEVVAIDAGSGSDQFQHPRRAVLFAGRAEAFDLHLDGVAEDAHKVAHRRFQTAVLVVFEAAKQLAGFTVVKKECSLFCKTFVKMILTHKKALFLPATLGTCGLARQRR